MAAIIALSLRRWISLSLYRSGHCNLSQFFFAKLFQLCWVAWGHRDCEWLAFFKSSHKILHWLEIQPLAWPFQDINIFVSMSFLCSFGFMLGVVVLLESLPDTCVFLSQLLKTFWLGDLHLTNYEALERNWLHYLWSRYVKLKRMYTHVITLWFFLLFKLM